MQRVVADGSMLACPKSGTVNNLQVSSGRTAMWRYATAIAIVELAVVARKALDPQLADQFPFFTFFAAIAAITWLGGLGPSLLSTVLGFVAAELFFVHHPHPLLMVTSLDLAIAGRYFVGTSIIVILGHAMHKARQRATARQIEMEREIGERVSAEKALLAAHDELEYRVRQRTAELNRAMEARELERRRFDEVLELLPVCVALLTPDHHMVFANRMFRERFGESEGRRCFEYLFDRAAPCEVCECHRVLETGQPHGWECAGIDGSLYEVFDFPFTDSDGSTLILKVNVDMTESKRAKARLTEQAALLQLAHDAIMVADLTGKISFWNRGAEELYGWRTDEAMGGNLHQLLQTTFPIPLNEIVALTQDHGQWEGELSHVTRSGQTVVVASRWSLQPDNAGKPGSILEISRDVTERRRAEEELHLNRQRLALALKAGHSGNFDWDIQNNLYVWSPEIEELYGVAPGELGGRHESWESLLLPEDLEIARGAIQESFRTGEFQSEWRVRRRNDGQIRWLSGRGKVFFDEAGRPSRMLGTNVDITDRKRAEEALRESNRKLHQLSGDLLRAQDYERRRIARELHDSTSQLLAALSINLDRLQEPGLEPDRRRQALSEAGELAAACSREIRTVTYLLHPPLLDEIGIVSALQAYAQGFTQRTGIQVEIKIPPDFGRLSRELEATLFRIVQEALANVHKHSGSPLAVIRLERDSHEVRLVLQDRGRGLPEALHRQPKGFVRFGVGIMGMRERAEQLGGRLEIASNEKGARLTVTLPLVHQNEETANLVGR